MGIYYKLTDQQMRTRSRFQWRLNEKFVISKDRQDPNRRLCSDSWFHVYNDPILAVLLNPIHANIRDPRLFECECSGYCSLNRGLKVGFTGVQLIKELPLPVITLTQKITFSILCAKAVYTDVHWNKWADNWLESVNRSSENAEAAAEAAWAAEAAAKAAAEAAWAAEADWAAKAAAKVIWAAAWAAEADWAAKYAAGAAAEAAAEAAEAAWAIDIFNFNLVSLANKIIFMKGE